MVPEWTFRITSIWNSGSDNTMSDAFATWTGTGRSPASLPSVEQYMPISGSSSGLYYLETVISWDAFPRMVNQVWIIWSAGGNPYDCITVMEPWDPAIDDKRSDE